MERSNQKHQSLFQAKAASHNKEPKLGKGESSLVPSSQKTIPQVSL